MVMLCAMLPAGAWAEIELHMTNREQGNHTLTIFEAQEKADESAQKQDDEQSEVSQAAEKLRPQLDDLSISLLKDSGLARHINLR